MLPLVFYLVKKDSYPLCFILLKNTVSPLVFFPWRPKKTDSVTLMVFYTLCFILLKMTALPFIFFAMMTKKTTVLPLTFYLVKKRQCYPLYLIWFKMTVLPHIFSITTKKTDSVTPCVLFGEKTAVLPLMGFFMTTNKRTTLLHLMVYLVKTWQCYPLSFIHDDQRKPTVSPLLFFIQRYVLLD